MSLLKTSFLNSIAVVTRLGTALFLNKVLAVYVGPAGYAIIGQFQSIVSMVTTFASGSINTGVTKYTAEYHGHEEKQITVWRTAGVISVIGALSVALLLVLFNEPLALFALKDKSLSGVFIWLASGLVLCVFNGLLLAILNGKKEVGRYVTANITGSLIGAVSAAVLASQFGLYGALVALAINQALTFIMTLNLCRRAAWFKIKNLFGQIDCDIAKKLGGYTLMSATTAIVVPISHILIREYLSNRFGIRAAGYWQAVWKISDLYLMLVTTTLSIYYLPRLSEIRSSHELKHEITQGYQKILPVAAVGAFAIYFLRDYIIKILFTADFAPMRDLFTWQLIGDVVKIASWLLGYVLIGRAMVTLVVVTEIFFASSFVCFTMLFTKYLGVSGVTFAFFVNYVVHWFTMFYLVTKYSASLKENENASLANT